jgi:hypothetical protein
MVEPRAWFGNAQFFEPMFHAWRFRPVKKTSIEVLQRVAETVPV